RGALTVERRWDPGPSGPAGLTRVAPSASIFPRQFCDETPNSSAGAPLHSLNRRCRRRPRLPPELAAHAPSTGDPDEPPGGMGTRGPGGAGLLRRAGDPGGPKGAYGAHSRAGLVVA